MTNYKTYRVYFNTDQGQAFQDITVSEDYVNDKGLQSFIDLAIKRKAENLGATNPSYSHKVEVVYNE